ncbi:MAG TPA: RAMP superfamily CRISPR-associated protein [Spirochaetota bacterium]|jgi:CRISPR/Cas system CSM-associated protein Csm3 (group 7 of RAMP superfamily)|nr:MAG: RAMP superfamily protein [Spirochaetes bacterium ADurb.Bin133]HNZ26289.1 RAMP superfamily CRISPR-associated protein [Spirochaetota bacterium]HPY87544.1 RAMP superfamily CRISPR-associated protein [Spirochaetota bacterium]
MKQIIINFKLETLEDFHIGSGELNIGLYDDGQIKENNLPCIPSDTFKGLLRQSCREIVNLAKVEQTDTNYGDIFSMIFDYKALESLDISLSFDREADINKGKDYFIIHTSNEVDSVTGITKEKSLRSLECARKGLIFNGELRYILWNDEKEKIAIELLEYGLKNIKRIGGNRRRGLGLVRILDINLAEQKNVNNNEKELEKLKESDNCKIKAVIELLDNVTIGSASEMGNYTPTLDYIPSSTVFGMLRKNLCCMKKGANNLSDYLDDGAITITDFYPIPSNNIDYKNIKNIIPIPFSLRKIKDADRYVKKENGNNISLINKNIPHWIYKDNLPKIVKNLATQSTLIPTKKGEDKTSDKSFKGGYIIEETDKKIEESIIYSPKLKAIMRNRVDEASQTTKDNALFTQQQIEKNSFFMGTIQFKSANDKKEFIADFKDYLNGNYSFHIGRGGKAIRVKYVFEENNISAIDNIVLHNKSIKNLLNNKTDDSYFTITLLSDVVLYDENLNQLDDISSDIIAGLINIDKSNVSIINKASFSDIIQGFLGTAGLRKFTDIVIKKGSSYLFEYKGKIEDIVDKLIEIEKKGIGFKKNEGFGRILVNHPIHLFNRGKESDTASYKLEEVELDKYYKIKLQTNKEIYKKAAIIEKEKIGKISSLSKTFINSMISRIESDIKIDYFINLLEDRKENQNGELYADFLKILNTEFEKSKNQEETYRVLKIALEIAKNNKRGGDNE